MTLRNQPWRAFLAIVCAAAAGMSGQIAVDPYHERSAYIAPTILIVVGLLFAWLATRSRLRLDRILGYPAFGLLSLVVIFMFLDRAH